MSKPIEDRSQKDSLVFEKLNVSREGAVLFAAINAPPMNLEGPELIRDLVSLIQQAEADDTVQVIVFKSADPDYFISHVDVTRIKENREAAAKLDGDPSIGQVLRHISASRLVTIAQIEGRVRGVGSEFILACDMRFAARESAIFGQFEPAFGVIPGAGAAQHLTRLMGRARALPADELGAFVRSLALRIASFPAAGHAGQESSQRDRARSGRRHSARLRSLERCDRRLLRCGDACCARHQYTELRKCDCYCR
jgi:enoyl-CoA hydratase/carnithine racemase